jgi:hypothetical protein
MIRLFQRRRQPNYNVNGEKLVRLPNTGDPQPVRDLWYRTHKIAKDYYTANKAPDPEMEGRNAAWRAVNIYQTTPGKVGWVKEGPVTWRESQVVNDPGSVSVIGKLIEVTYLTQRMTFDVVRFKEPGLPDLLWDDDTKRLLCYTGLPDGYEQHVNKVSSPRLRSEIERENKMYRRWHKRPASKVEIVGAPPTEVLVNGAADAIVYRSDKWDEPNPDPDLVGSPEYLHQHDLGVFMSRNPGTATPKLIVVQGGKLDALTAGIIH